MFITSPFLSVNIKCILCNSYSHMNWRPGSIRNGNISNYCSINNALVFGENNIDTYRNYSINNSRGLLSQSINLCHLPCLNNSDLCSFKNTQPYTLSKSNFTSDVTLDSHSTFAKLPTAASTSEATVTTGFNSDKKLIKSVEFAAVKEVCKGVT